MGDAAQRAASMLAEQGILMSRWARQPLEDPPDVPRDLTEQRDSELMTLFRRVNDWVKYLGLQLSAAQVDERHDAAQVVRIEALEGYDFRRIDAKTRAYNDQKYLAAKDKAEGSHGYRKMVEALHGNVETDAFYLSREITRRGNGGARDGRANRGAN